MGRKKVYRDTPSREKASRDSQQQSNARRVRLGLEKERWDAVKIAERLDTDVEVARFLIDRYRLASTPPPPTPSTPLCQQPPPTAASGRDAGPPREEQPVLEGSAVSIGNALDVAVSQGVGPASHSSAMQSQSPGRTCIKCKRLFVTLDTHVDMCLLCQGCKPSRPCTVCSRWTMHEWSVIIDEHSRRGAQRWEKRHQAKSLTEGSHPPPSYTAAVMGMQAQNDSLGLTAALPNNTHYVTTPVTSFVTSPAFVPPPHESSGAEHAVTRDTLTHLAGLQTSLAELASLQGMPPTIGGISAMAPSLEPEMMRVINIVPSGDFDDCPGVPTAVAQNPPEVIRSAPSPTAPVVSTTGFLAGLSSMYPAINSSMNSTSGVRTENPISDTSRQMETLRNNPRILSRPGSLSSGLVNSASKNNDLHTVPTGGTPLLQPPIQYPSTHVVDLTMTESWGDKTASNKSATSKPNFLKHAKTVFNALLNDNISMLGLRKGTDQKLPDGSQKFVYQCNFCVSFVSSLEGLLNHVQRHVFVCAVCKFQSFLRSKIVHHSLMAHSSARFNLLNLDVVKLKEDSVMGQEDGRMKCEDMVQFIPVSPESLAPLEMPQTPAPDVGSEEDADGVYVCAEESVSEEVQPELEPEAESELPSNNPPAIPSIPPCTEKPVTRSRHSSASTAAYSYELPDPGEISDMDSVASVTSRALPFARYLPNHCRKPTSSFGRATRHNKRPLDMEVSEACLKKHADVIRDCVVILEEIRGSPYMPESVGAFVNLKSINLNASPPKVSSAEPPKQDVNLSGPSKTLIVPAEKVTRQTRRSNGEKLVALPWDWNSKKIKNYKYRASKMPQVKDPEVPLSLETTPAVRPIDKSNTVWNEPDSIISRVASAMESPPKDIHGVTIQPERNATKKEANISVEDKNGKSGSSLGEKEKDEQVSQTANALLEKSGSKRPILGEIWMQSMKKIDPTMEIVVPCPDKIKTVYRPDFAEPWKVAKKLLQTKEKISICRVCNYQSSNFVHVREHIGEVHLGLALWMCPHCPLVKGRRTTVLDHLATEHATLDHFVIRCRNYNSGLPKEIIAAALPTLPSFKCLSDEEVEMYAKDTLKNLYKKGSAPATPMRKMAKFKCRESKAKKGSSLKYKCYYCSYHSTDLKQVKGHCISKHEDQMIVDRKFGFVADVVECGDKKRRLFCCPNLRCTYQAHKKYLVYIHMSRECRAMIGNDKSLKPGLQLSANFQCTYCYKRGSGPTIIKNHIKSYHPNQKIIVQDIKQRALRKRSLHFMCGQCSYSSPFSDQLHSHLKVHGPAQMKPLLPLKPIPVKPAPKQSPQVQQNAAKKVKIKEVSRNNTEVMDAMVVDNPAAAKGPGQKVGNSSKSKRPLAGGESRGTKRSRVSHVRPPNCYGGVSYASHEADLLQVPTMQVSPEPMLPVVRLTKLNVDASAPAPAPAPGRKQPVAGKNVRRRQSGTLSPASRQISPGARLHEEFIDRSGLSYARCRFKCRLCQFADDNPKSIKKHILSQHEGQYIVVQDMRMKMAQKPSISYLCPHCDIACGTSKELTDHIRLLPHHAKPPLNWQDGDSNKANAQEANNTLSSGDDRHDGKVSIAVDTVPIRETPLGEGAATYMSLSVMGTTHNGQGKPTGSRVNSLSGNNGQVRKGSPGISQHTAASRLSPPTVSSTGDQNTLQQGKSVSEQMPPDSTTSSKEIPAAASQESLTSSVAVVDGNGFTPSINGPERLPPFHYSDEDCLTEGSASGPVVQIEVDYAPSDNMSSDVRHLPQPSRINDKERMGQESSSGRDRTDALPIQNDCNSDEDDGNTDNGFGDDGEVHDLDNSADSDKLVEEQDYKVVQVIDDDEDEEKPTVVKTKSSKENHASPSICEVDLTSDDEAPSEDMTSKQPSGGGTVTINGDVNDEEAEDMELQMEVTSGDPIGDDSSQKKYPVKTPVIYVEHDEQKKSPVNVIHDLDKGEDFIDITDDDVVDTTDGACTKGDLTSRHPKSHPDMTNLLNETGSCVKPMKLFKVVKTTTSGGDSTSTAAVQSDAANNSASNPCVISSKPVSPPPAVSNSDDGVLSTNSKTFRIMGCRHCNTTCTSLYQMKRHVLHMHEGIKYPFVRDMSRSCREQTVIYICPYPECDFAGYGINKLVHHRFSVHLEKLHANFEKPSTVSTQRSDTESPGIGKGVYLRCYHCNFVSIVAEVRHHLKVFHGVLIQIATFHNSLHGLGKLYLCRYLNCDFMCYELEDYTSHECGDKSAPSSVYLTTRGLRSSKPAAWNWDDAPMATPTADVISAPSSPGHMTTAITSSPIPGHLLTDVSSSSPSTAGHVAPPVTSVPSTFDIMTPSMPNSASALLCRIAGVCSAASTGAGAVKTTSEPLNPPQDVAYKGDPFAPDQSSEVDLNEEGDDNWQVTLEDDESTPV